MINITIIINMDMLPIVVENIIKNYIIFKPKNKKELKDKIWKIKYMEYRINY